MNAAFRWYYILVFQGALFKSGQRCYVRSWLEIYFDIVMNVRMNY